MQFNEIDWTPILLAIALGAAIGVALVVNALRRRGAVKPADPQLLLRDLEGQRDALVLQIRELDDADDKLTVEEIQRTRYELELKLASTLREIGGTAVAVKNVRSAPPAVAPLVDEEEVLSADGYRTARGFLWGIAGAAAIAALAVFVLQTAEPKEPQPAMAGTQQAGILSDSQLAEIQAAVSAHPDDLDLRVELAKAYLLRNDMMAVWNETKYVLDRSSDHPRALSYAALVKFQMGEHDAAIEMLQTALKKDPSLVDGWIHLAIVLNEIGRHGDAKALIAEAKQKRPDQAQVFDSLLAEIEMRAHPEQAPAMASLDPAAAVGGIVQVGNGAAAPAANASLFLIARDAAAPAGPPVAVKRMAISGFPLQFQLDGRDSMMGQPLPAKMIIEARIDTDGSPALSAGELSGTAPNVQLGTTDLQIVLQ
jgi:tetratricopeptide (TPR) repeat protein